VSVFIKNITPKYTLSGIRYLVSKKYECRRKGARKRVLAGMKS